MEYEEAVNGLSGYDLRMKALQIAMTTVAPGTGAELLLEQARLIEAYLQEELVKVEVKHDAQSR